MGAQSSEQMRSPSDVVKFSVLPVERIEALSFVLASAAVLVLALVVGWAWKAHWLRGTGANVATNLPYQKVTLDLRNRLILRGDQAPSANSGPIELPRGRLDLTVLLAKGSRPGNYEVRVSTELDRTIMSVTGTATLENGNASLNVKLDLSRLGPGTYVLAIDQAGAERNEYPLVLK